jgi:hypothetical protein
VPARDIEHAFTMTSPAQFLLYAAAMTMAPCAVIAAAPVAVGIDFNARGRPISPLIYGVSFGDAAQNRKIGYTLERWGGNSTTRYNWRGPAHNAGADYFFLGYGSDQTGDADGFIASAAAAGALALMTVPTIGWVEKFDGAHPTGVNWAYSQIKYGAQTLDECRFYNPQPDWCHGDAGNGLCDSKVNKTAYCIGGRIVGNDPADTSIGATPADVAAWIAHLQQTFGAADAGGVKLYALDNELMLWNSTHRDVHPEPVGFDEAWSRTFAYATAIRQAEPGALVTGPVTWGYCDLFGSAKDNCVVGSDRDAHGLPFVAWYLQQVCANPLAGGKRAIDFLDLHYYPQDPNGSATRIVSDADDATTAARRLGSLKELYDPAWVTTSWIADLGDDATWHYSKPDLIPRVRAWIDQYCPGTRLAITEYNWGADGTASGAVAQAELLGIFAREGVDLAARWVAPAAGSNVEKAFSLFLDYDAAGARVQGESVAATSSNVDQIGAYAFRDYGRHEFVLLTNKDTSSHSVALALAQGQAGTCALYGFDASQALHSIPLTCGAGSTLTVSGLAPMSASLLVLPDADGLFRAGFEP